VESDIIQRVQRPEGASIGDIKPFLLSNSGGRRIFAYEFPHPLSQMESLPDAVASQHYYATAMEERRQALQVDLEKEGSSTMRRTAPIQGNQRSGDQASYCLAQCPSLLLLFYSLALA
jgi:hypothetical protein